VIRAAADDDAEAIVALWTEAYFTEGEGGRAAPYTRSDFDRTAATAAHFLVAELDGTIVGVVALLTPGAKGRAVARDGEAELCRLAVAASARRHGIGRGLVEHCAELSRSEGWRSIALWSRTYQRAAHRLYESLDYRRDPDRDSVDETGFERLVYCLTLER
jgi:ribosomal protein S18 acetylase RimI-like enzyme